jgi:hypothetical protein
MFAPVKLTEPRLASVCFYNEYDPFRLLRTGFEYFFSLKRGYRDWIVSLRSVRLESSWRNSYTVL